MRAYIYMMICILFCIIFIGTKGDHEGMKTNDELNELIDAFTSCGLKNNKNGINEKMDVLMLYFDDNVVMCSPNGINMDEHHKYCFRGKDELRNYVNTFVGKYIQIDYTINPKWHGKNYVEIQIEFQYKEKSGCIIDVEETENIAFDENGKVMMFDSIRQTIKEIKNGEKCEYDEHKSPAGEEELFSKYPGLDEPVVNEYGINDLEFLLLNSGVSVISCLMVIACCLTVYYFCFKYHQNGANTKKYSFQKVVNDEEHESINC